MQHAIILHILKTKHTNLCLTSLPPQASTRCFCLHLQQKSLEKDFPSLLLLPCFLKTTPEMLPSQLLSFNEVSTRSPMIFSKSKGQSSDSSSLRNQQRLTKLIILILLTHFHQLVWVSSLLWPLLLSPCWFLLFSPTFGFLFPIIVIQTLGLFFPIIFPLVVLTLNLPSIH